MDAPEIIWAKPDRSTVYMDGSSPVTGMNREFHGAAKYRRADISDELLTHLEGIVHFADGFACYHDAGPAGQALREWINGARRAIALATGST